MGKQVASVISQSGCHETVAVLDVDTPVVPEVFHGSDAIIDFTVRDAFLGNLPAMLSSGVPIIVGKIGRASCRERV